MVSPVLYSFPMVTVHPSGDILSFVRYQLTNMLPLGVSTLLEVILITVVSDEQEVTNAINGGFNPFSKIKKTVSSEQDKVIILDAKQSALFWPLDKFYKYAQNK